MNKKTRLSIQMFVILRHFYNSISFYAIFIVFKVILVIIFTIFLGHLNSGPADHSLISFHAQINKNSICDNSEFFPIMKYFIAINL